MDAVLLEYLPVLIFFAIALAMGIGFIVAAAVLAPSDPDPEKVSTYECGFNAFEDARMKFDVRFYLVAILHHLRPRSGVPLSVDIPDLRRQHLCVLVDDGVSRRADRRVPL